MFSSSFILSILFFSSVALSGSNAISCFVGPQDDTVVEAGFDYCVSTVNVKTHEISYGGRAGYTTVFTQTNPNNLALNHCFIHIYEDPYYTSCFCEESHCNTKKTISEFRRMIFESRDF